MNTELEKEVISTIRKTIKLFMQLSEEGKYPEQMFSDKGGCGYSYLSALLVKLESRDKYVILRELKDESLNEVNVEFNKWK